MSKTKDADLILIKNLKLIPEKMFIHSKLSKTKSVKRIVFLYKIFFFPSVKYQPDKTSFSSLILLSFHIFSLRLLNWLKILYLFSFRSVIAKNYKLQKNIKERVCSKVFFLTFLTDFFFCYVFFFYINLELTHLK